MASTSKRFFTRLTFSTLKSSLNPKIASTSLPLRKPSNPTMSSSSSGLPPLPVSRFHTEVRCLTSLLPLHSTVASARMTSHLSSTSRSIAALLQGYELGNDGNDLSDCGDVKQLLQTETTPFKTASVPKLENLEDARAETQAHGKEDHIMRIMKNIETMKPILG